MCEDLSIKELLPFYQKNMLEPLERDQIDRHLVACEDCRTELQVLTLMADEAVPDPGDAFWATMPGRVRRGIQAERNAQPTSILERLRGFAAPGRLAWTSAAIAVLALVTWHLYRPAFVGILDPSFSNNGVTIVADAPVELLNVAELTQTELTAVSQWAQNAIDPIHEQVGAYVQETDDRSISEDLSSLSARELDRLYELLKKKEQETREKSQKKPDRVRATG